MEYYLHMCLILWKLLNATENSGYKKKRSICAVWLSSLGWGYHSNRSIAHPARLCWSFASKTDEWFWAEFHLEAHEGVTIRLISLKVWVQSMSSLAQKFPRRLIHFRVAQGGPSFPSRLNWYSVSSLDLLKTTCVISMSDSFNVCSRYSEICDHYFFSEN